MTAKYELTNGEILVGYVYSDLLDDGDDGLRTNFEVKNLTKKTKSKVRQVFKDENGKYFCYKNEKIYFKNFSSMTYTELCDKLEQ